MQCHVSAAWRLTTTKVQPPWCRSQPMTSFRIKSALSERLIFMHGGLEDKLDLHEDHGQPGRRVTACSIAIPYAQGSVELCLGSEAFCGCCPIPPSLMRPESNCKPEGQTDAWDLVTFKKTQPAYGLFDLLSGESDAVCLCKGMVVPPDGTSDSQLSWFKWFPRSISSLKELSACNTVRQSYIDAIVSDIQAAVGSTSCSLAGARQNIPLCLTTMQSGHDESVSTKADHPAK